MKDFHWSFNENNNHDEHHNCPIYISVLILKNQCACSLNCTMHQCKPTWHYERLVMSAL